MQSSSSSVAGGASTVDPVNPAAEDLDADDFTFRAPPVDTAVHGRQSTECGLRRGSTLRG